MKNLIAFFCAIISAFSFAQTFSGSGLPIGQNTWNGTQDVIVSVSGLSSPLTSGSLELIQANIEIKRSNGNISTSVAYEIISPNGTIIVLDPTGYNGPAVSHMDFKFRDPCSNGGCSNLETVQGLTGFSLAAPYNVGFYAPDVSCSFGNVLGENPNGNWIVRFTETSNFEEPEIIKVELVFGTLTNVDISNSTTNDDCTAPQIFCENKPVCYDNISHTGNNITDPAVGGSCAWNLSLDNTGWFYWIASSTTALIEVSGLSSNQQIIAVGDNGTGCIQSDLYILDGGCPEDPVNNNSTYNNGDNHNMELNVSNLTIGETYYFIVDGEGGSTSSAYLTLQGGTNCTPNNLPIELINFKGENKNRTNQLYWTTVTEINNDFFVIERSTDLKSWEEIGTIEGAGSSNTKINYQFTDFHLLDDLYYYRLKQFDFDGVFSYSKTITIKTNQMDYLFVYPNPFKSNLTVKLPETYSSSSEIKLIDISGRVIQSGSIDGKSSEYIFEFNKEILQGQYFVEFSTSEGKYITKVIKL